MDAKDTKALRGSGCPEPKDERVSHCRRERRFWMALESAIAFLGIVLAMVLIVLPVSLAVALLVMTCVGAAQDAETAHFAGAVVLFASVVVFGTLAFLAASER